MKTLNQLACLLVVTAASGALVQAAKPAGAGITKETLIFKLDKSRDIRENRGLHSMQLSPDGKMLLYVQQAPKAADQDRGYRLVLRDIKAGKDTVLPGAPSGSDDFLVAYTSMNPFDAKGKKLVIPVAAGDKPVRPGKGTMQLGVYDIKSGKLDKPDLSGPIIFPTYDAGGGNLIVFVMARGEHGPDPAGSKIVVSPVDKIKFRKIGIVGLTRSPCPGTSVMPILLIPPNRDAPDGGRGTPKFVLYDTKSDKQLAAPTVHSGSRLDDYNPQWTADGRFLYYFDTEKDSDPDGGIQDKSIVRVWDRGKNIERAIIEGAIPVGPGPGESTMILLKTMSRLKKKGPGYVIDDPTSSKTVSLGGEGIRILYARGGLIVYVKENADDQEQVFHAEIKLSGAKKK